MDNATYVGLSKQILLRQELDIAANNMANVNTAGFKIESLINQDDPVTPPNAPRGGAPVQFVIGGGVTRDFSQGALQQTGAPLDMAIEGQGFFQVQTASGVQYTRDGRFATNAQNQLVTQAGDPVLDASGSPITLNSQGDAPMIGGDGTITQKVPGQPQAVQVGKVGVVQFAALSNLSKQGDGLYNNTSTDQPTAASASRVRQGMLETSNVQPILEVTNLIRISRAYEAVTQMVGNTADLSERAIQRLGSAQ